MPLQIYKHNNAVLVQRTKDFSIKSLFLQGPRNDISWSIHFLYINGHKQSKVFNIPSGAGKTNNRAFYQIMTNNIVFSINDRTTVLNKGELFVVTQDIKHYFFNPNDDQAIVIMNYPGKMEFKKKLDTVDDLIPQTQKPTQSRKDNFISLDPSSF